MPFFPSLPEDAGVAALWEVFNPKAREGLPSSRARSCATTASLDRRRRR